jgi:hypothetical protein
MITNRPRSIISYKGREIDCQDALRSAFKALLVDAQNAGWSDDEAACALSDLIEEYFSGQDQRSEMEIAEMVDRESTKH